MFFGILSNCCKVAQAIAQYHLRYVYVSEYKHAPTEAAAYATGVFKIVLFSGLAMNKLIKAMAGDTGSKHGYVGKVPIPLVVSGIGLLLTGFASYQIHHHRSDEVDPAAAYAWDPEFQAEEVCTLISAIAVTFSFLNWSKVCNATVVDGIPMSTVGLMFINMSSLFFYLTYSGEYGILSKAK